MAAKAMSKTALIRHLAETNDMTRAQVSGFLDSLAETAYRESKNGFTLPGLGKLVLKHRKARMGRNPATGETIRIKAKKVVKFRVAKACKDSILGTGTPKKKTRKKAARKK
ncbi:MAG: HU family DNA-binding protein [Phycisphaerae bacterium]